MMQGQTMQAVAWQAPQTLARVTMPRPALLHPRDAVVRVQCASTCGTDLHIYRGAIPGFEPGTVPGHEFTGVVDAVGAEVTRFRPGQRVRSCDFAACGQCAQCAAGRHAQCGQRMLFGFSGIQPRLDGALAEYVRVPWADAVLDPLPDSADPRIGLLAADVLPTALGALALCQAEAGARIAVVGAGPVGLLVALIAAARGLRPLLVESDPQRAAHARAAGIDTVSCADSQPASAAAAVDAVGGSRGIAAALALVRRGGRVIGVGSQSGCEPVDLGRMFQQELSLHFVIGNALGMRATLEQDMHACAPHLDAMFSDHISLDQVPGYYERLQQRSAFKAVVHIGDGGLHA